MARTGIVKGRVQGVGFRYFVLEAAADLGLSGWVRNRSDGTVEYRVQGPASPVADFLRKLEEGPPLSRVDQVTRGEMPVDPGLQGFRVTD